MIGAFRAPVSSWLRQANAGITFVDVGSRNGILDLADLAPFVEAWGFEPNPAEYEKLISGNTDVFRIAGIKSPRYRRIAYFPYALSNQTGKAQFCVTPGAGAAGLLEPDLERLSEIKWKGRSFRGNFADEVFAGYRSVEVETRRLCDWADEHKVEYIDYLKVDVEGSEYEMLEGAIPLLPRTGVVKTEVCFVPFRQGQRLFSEVDLLLRKYGFDLIQYRVDPAQVGYKERSGPLQLLPVGVPDPHAQPLQADAFYVNRTIQDPVRSLVQAAVLLDFDLVDPALHVLCTRTKVGKDEWVDRIRTWHRGATTGRWLRGHGYRAVDRLISAAGRLSGWRG